jgi:hypothetical protein
MKKTIQVKLKNHFSHFNEYSAEVVTKGNMNVEDIVDDMLNEGFEISRDTILEIIQCFTHKSIELALSGYNVKTGIVNLQPIVKVSASEKKWYPAINKVTISITEGYELLQMVDESTLEVQNEQGEPLTMDQRGCFELQTFNPFFS